MQPTLRTVVTTSVLMLVLPFIGWAQADTAQASTTIAAARKAYKSGQFAEALELSEQGVAGFKRATKSTTDSATYAKLVDALTLRAFMLRKNNRAQESANSYPEICDTIMSRWDETHPELTWIWFRRAQRYYLLNKWDSGVYALQRATHLIGEFHPDQQGLLASCINFLGVLHMEKGDFEAAHQHYLKAHNMKREMFGEISEQVAKSHFNFGLLCQDTDRDQKALNHFLKALELHTQLGNKRNVVAASIQVNVANGYFAVGEYGKALDHIDQALEIQQDFYEPDDYSVLLAINLMAQCMRHSETTERPLFNGNGNFPCATKRWWQRTRALQLP